MVPAHVIQRLRCLVEVVEPVAGVEIAVVRRGGGQHLCQLFGRTVRGDSGPQHPFGAVGVTHLHVLPEPRLQPLDGHVGCLERRLIELRRLVGTVTRDLHQPLIERSLAVLLREVVHPV